MFNVDSSAQKIPAYTSEDTLTIIMMARISFLTRFRSRELTLSPITLHNETVKYCIGAVPPFWNQRRSYDMGDYHAPSFCKVGSKSVLKFVHNDLNAQSSTVVEGETDGLSRAISGKINGFQVVSRDPFGNVRSGDST